MDKKTHIKLSKDESYEVEITDLAAGGKGVARIDGKVVFVEKAIPGQKVVIRVFKDRRDYAEARTVSIVRNSPHYTEPRCSHFAYCGGCSLQNMQYEEQIRYKRIWLADALKKIGGLENVDVCETVPSPDVFYYRNKMEFSFGNKIWNEKEAKIESPGFGLGLHLPGRFDTIVNIEDCYLQSAVSAKIVNIVRDFARNSGLPVYDIRRQKGFWRFLIIREGKKTDSTLINIVTNKADQKELDIVTELGDILTKEAGSSLSLVHAEHPGKSQAAVWERIRIVAGRDFIEEKIGTGVFRVESATFFQVNTLQVENLYAAIKEGGNFSGDEVVYDLYSGTGTIPLYLAGAVKRIVGIELEEASVEAAKENAARNNIENCSFIQGKVRSTIKYPPALYKEFGKPDVVVTDPPRSGMDPKTVERIMSLNPGRIIYVSCNPATLARDLSVLAENYAVKHIVPVDMFPHTAHLESVSFLERKEQA